MKRKQLTLRTETIRELRTPVLQSIRGGLVATDAVMCATSRCNEESMYTGCQWTMNAAACMG
jgi:hypothetical protein